MLVGENTLGASLLFPNPTPTMEIIALGKQVCKPLLCLADTLLEIVLDPCK
jgi:hypothetical protein